MESQFVLDRRKNESPRDRRLSFLIINFLSICLFHNDHPSGRRIVCCVELIIKYAIRIVEFRLVDGIRIETFLTVQ